MNIYLIEFTIHDGEAEYRQFALVQAKLPEEATEKAEKILQKGSYKGDDRLYEVETATLLNMNELKVIEGLGLAYEL